jgi:hypothetical protein
MAEVIRPKGTEEGSYEWMSTTANLARHWASNSDRDARQLVKYLRDLKNHNWRQLILGADNWDHFCREILGYEPEFIQEMEEGVAILERQGHEGTISEDMATAAGRSELAANATTGEVLAPHTHPDGQFAYQIQSERARSSGISPRQQRKLDALARRAPNLLNAVKAGELSTHRACVQAGIVKEPTGYQLLCRAWDKASKEEKDRFMTEKNQEGW